MKVVAFWVAMSWTARIVDRISNMMGDYGRNEN
jgi:hypothetical protein